MSTSLDEDLTVLESLDFDTSCDALPGCSNTARWLMEKRCCLASYMFCVKCRNNLMTVLQNSALECFCADCGSKPLLVSKIDWTPL